MKAFPKKLQQNFDERVQHNSKRDLPTIKYQIDFSSNDYLGFAKNETLYANTFQYLLNKGVSQNGATGSRLLSGNHGLYKELEEKLKEYHETEAALVFNSGYDANIGFFSSIPQRNDFVFYDEFIHASIRDGINLGNAKSYKFKHNDLDDLKDKIKLSIPKESRTNDTQVYVVTESVFSMDGDSPDLKKLSKFCEDEGFFLVVDEAHAIGVLGKNGVGLVQELALQNKIFARIVTFGKALGCHGAAILGSTDLKNYLVNFARSFIYTTGLPPHSVASAFNAYLLLDNEEGNAAQKLLLENIAFFKSKVADLELADFFITSDSAIHSCVISGIDQVKTISKNLVAKGFDIKAILSPTVPEGKERLRFCLHTYNSKEEIGLVLQWLAKFLKTK